MLEVWDAERFEEEKQGGRTHPLVIECTRIAFPALNEIADKSAATFETLKRLLLVKAANKELTERGLFCEVYGNLIAREFGVNTPAPARVRISPEFVQALQLSPQTKHIALAPGYGVGCEYLRGLAPLQESNNRNNEEQADIQAIYGVDLLIQNPDRRPDKPNCASYQGGILAFDFELAFSFLLPIFGAHPPAWEVDKHGIAPRHLFYRELRRRKQLDWKPFLLRLRSLTDERLAALFASLPVEWQPYADRVTAHIREVCDNEAKFGEALVRSLL